MTLGESFKNQNRSDEKIISDGLEALLGAIFLDQGMNTVEKFILNIMIIFFTCNIPVLLNLEKKCLPRIF